MHTLIRANSLAAALFFSALASIAQENITLRGQIMSPGGVPVSECVVSLASDSIYAISDNGGNFELVPARPSRLQIGDRNISKRDQTEMVFHVGPNGRADFYLYSLNGKQIAVFRKTRLRNGMYALNLETIPVQGLAEGMYFIKIETESSSGTHKYFHAGKNPRHFVVRSHQESDASFPQGKISAMGDTLNILCPGRPMKQVFLNTKTAEVETVVVDSFPAKRPNILFAIADDWSYPHAGAYGAKFLNTPAFDRVAKEGILFHNVYYTSPGCAPSRASLVSGRNTWENEQAGSHATRFPEYLEDAYKDGKSVHVPGAMAPVKLESFSEYLTAQGYNMAYTGKAVSPFQHERPEDLVGKKFDGKTINPPASGMEGNDYAANFGEFLKVREKGKPFFFWYGGMEPHRGYEKYSGFQKGKKRLEDVTVPGFLPDNQEVRHDLLDYAFEVDYFDLHLGRMIEQLEQLGELENTVIIVTGDNGMPFPRGKANGLYDAGTRAPFAVRWGKGIPGDRAVHDFISFADLAPTFLELAGSGPGKIMTGRSFLNVLLSGRSGQVDPSRKQAVFGRERHSNSRRDNVGYPSRGIRTKDYLYVRNFKPDRWPAGDPPESGAGCYFRDLDDGITPSHYIDYWKQGTNRKFTDLALAKRPLEEFFDLKKDPEGLVNVAADPVYADAKGKLWNELKDALTKGGDPRILGYGEVWDSYPRFGEAKCSQGWFASDQYNPGYWDSAVKQAEALGIVIKQNR